MAKSYCAVCDHCHKHEVMPDSAFVEIPPGWYVQIGDQREQQWFCGVECVMGDALVKQQGH